MTGPMKRALAAGALALLSSGTAQLVYATLLCRPGHVLRAVRAGSSMVVLDRGERTARTGDATFTCETAHTVGPLRLHDDLDCYCAPHQFSPEELSRLVAGRCTLDNPSPLRTDAFGECRFARCSHYVD